MSLGIFIFNTKADKGTGLLSSCVPLYFFVYPLSLISCVLSTLKAKNFPSFLYPKHFLGGFPHVNFSIIHPSYFDSANQLFSLLFGRSEERRVGKEC